VRMRRGRSADDDLQGPSDASSRYNPHALMSGRDNCSADRPLGLSRCRQTAEFTRAADQSR